jgi:hypothetical protein
MGSGFRRVETRHECQRGDAQESVRGESDDTMPLKSPTVALAGLSRGMAISQATLQGMAAGVYQCPAPRSRPGGRGASSLLTGVREDRGRREARDGRRLIYISSP